MTVAFTVAWGAQLIGRPGFVMSALPRNPLTDDLAMGFVLFVLAAAATGVARLWRGRSLSWWTPVIAAGLTGTRILPDPAPVPGLFQIHNALLQWVVAIVISLSSRLTSRQTLAA